MEVGNEWYLDIKFTKSRRKKSKRTLKRITQAGKLWTPPSYIIGKCRHTNGKSPTKFARSHPAHSQ